ncbi:MAG: hypothetical protein ACYC99_07470 [Candidatus Geothermincolia bacterium]
MSSNGAMRPALAVALVFFCAFGLLAIQGCGSEGKSTSDQGEAQPQSNATSPANPGKDTVKPDTPADKTSQPTSGSQPDTSDSDAAVSAAKASATANNPSIGSLDVLGVKIIGSWARVDLEPSNKSADGASWLLKKTDGAWSVVEYGTTIMPTDHPEAPAGLFQ